MSWIGRIRKYFHLCGGEKDQGHANIPTRGRASSSDQDKGSDRSEDNDTHKHENLGAGVPSCCRIKGSEQKISVPDGFFGNPDLVQLEELLVGELWTKVGVKLANQADRVSLQGFGELSIAALASFPGNQPGRAFVLIPPAEAAHLAPAHAQHDGGLLLR